MVPIAFKVSNKILAALLHVIQKSNMPFSNAAEARRAITTGLEGVLHICTVASLTTHLLNEHSKYSLSVSF